MSNQRCYICGEDNPNVHEEHHVIPRRFDGPDARSNIVTLCANCHRALESIYDDSFFRAVKSEMVEVYGSPEESSQSVLPSEKAAKHFIDECLESAQNNYIKTDKVRQAYAGFAEKYDYPDLSARKLGGFLCSSADINTESTVKNTAATGCFRVYPNIEFTPLGEMYVSSA